MTRIKKLKKKIEQDNPSKDISYDEIKKYLEHYGFNLERVTGSHHIFRNDNGKIIILPIHNKRIKYVYIKQISNKIEKEI